MPSVSGRKVVATQHPMATLVGVKVLEEGGNAFDAAIAVSSTLGVVLPQTGGLGGDGFLLAKGPDGVIAYNASGWSPKSMRAEKVEERGPTSVTVPGLVDLWDFVHSNYSTKDLGTLLSYSISLATNGFHVDRGLHNSIVSSTFQDPTWRKIFGEKRMGDLLRLPNMAKVLKALSRDPRDFYEGRTAEELVTGLRRNGVPVDLEDFSDFRGEKVSPLSVTYKGYSVLELPPNSQGITTLQILKMVELSRINERPFNDLIRINNHAKIAVAAYRDRDRFLADPKFHPLPEYLLDEDYLRGRLNEEGVMYGIKGGDTTFFVVADGENEVGFIQSLYSTFGSGIVVNDIPFQNRGACFTQGLNRPEPRKRPLHTLSIMLADNDRETILIGCAGGHLRPQIHSEVLEYYVDYRMEIDEAVYAPRFMYTDGKIIAEKRLNVPGVQADYLSSTVGVVQALKKRGQVYTAVADPRSEGIALQAH
jgi:gamma-glutamyltranspeptidase/glutathione hydrolase